MEYALPELLTRNEILRILEERRLHVNNVDTLSLDELHCIYKRYGLPRAQREPQRNRATNTLHPPSSLTTTAIEDKTRTFADKIDKNIITSQLKRGNIDAATAMDIDVEHHIAQKRSKLLYMDACGANENTAPCEKRALDADLLACCNTTDNYLSSVTKRIRIDCAFSN